MYNRSLGWHTHHELDPNAADLYLLKIAKGLQDTETAKGLHDAIKSHTKNNNPKLIIDDTLSRYSTGIDENSNSDMAKLIEMITNELSIPLNCSVMLVHHTGKVGKSARSASALNGALDTEWGISKSKTGTLTATMTNTKSKDHAAPDALVFYMLTIPVEAGRDLTALVPNLIVNALMEVELTVEE
jgi:RecA-family ATPase